ncbi:uncharacterized protein AAES06_005871 [Glossophaga mutica]
MRISITCCRPNNLPRIECPNRSSHRFRRNFSLRPLGPAPPLRPPAPPSWAGGNEGSPGRPRNTYCLLSCERAVNVRGSNPGPVSSQVGGCEAGLHPRRAGGRPRGLGWRPLPRSRSERRSERPRRRPEWCAASESREWTSIRPKHDEGVLKVPENHFCVPDLGHVSWLTHEARLMTSGTEGVWARHCPLRPRHHSTAACLPTEVAPPGEPVQGAPKEVVDPSSGRDPLLQSICQAGVTSTVKLRSIREHKADKRSRSKCPGAGSTDRLKLQELVVTWWLWRGAGGCQ